MRWRIEWLAETLMIPIWLAGEWLEGVLPHWQTTKREATLYLSMTFPG